MQSLKQRFILAAKLLSLGKMKTSFLLLSLNRNIASRNRDKNIDLLVLLDLLDLLK